VFFLGAVILLWGWTVCIEAIAGNHLAHTQAGIKLRFGLFLFSEGMFFFAIFWVYLDSALNPAIEIGGTWPSMGIVPINPYGLPLFNTIVLLSRGLFATWSHHLLLRNKRAIMPLIGAIFLAFVFEGAQYKEFTESSFSMRDGIYGRIFFFGTGFHGLHVILGHLFLTFNAYRIYALHFTRVRHISFEFALLYWHFVDVVWIFLYVMFYWWVY